MEKLKDILFRLWIITSTITLGLVLVFIFIFILAKGLKVIDFNFIFTNPKGIPLGTNGGIFPAIVGSLLLMLISSAFASILAIATAIYTIFYSKSKRFNDLIHLMVQCIAGVPSIILGMFGYALMVVNLRIPRSLLVAGITLGIMIFPYIEVKVEKILGEIDDTIIISSYALGISKAYTIFKLAIPICLPEILATVLLAGSFAMGATAPIILTGAIIFAPVPKSALSPIMALPFHLYILLGEGISLENAFGTALVLLIILVAINCLAFVAFKKGARYKCQ